jgi:hypothetical protein
LAVVGVGDEGLVFECDVVTVILLGASLAIVVVSVDISVLVVLVVFGVSLVVRPSPITLDVRNDTKLSNGCVEGSIINSVVVINNVSNVGDEVLLQA